MASLLGYSSPADGPEGLCSGSGFGAGFPGASDAGAAPAGEGGHPDTHLAEILMKTLLRNLGFYTVSSLSSASEPRFLCRADRVPFLNTTHPTPVCAV